MFADDPERDPYPYPLSRAKLTVTDISHDADRVRIGFAGEVDMSTVADFDRALGDAVRARLCPVVEVDLGDVEFLDSSGLNTLVVWWREADAEGRALVVTRPQDIVRQILEMTGLLDLLMPSPLAEGDARGPAPAH